MVGKISFTHADGGMMEFPRQSVRTNGIGSKTKGSQPHHQKYKNYETPDLSDQRCGFNGHDRMRV
jgi:hypothetical protein